MTDDPGGPKAQDVIVLWNRQARYEKFATRFEAAGAKVIVAENGWIGRDADGNKLMALCLGHHNGAGTWHVGEHDRWAGLGIELAPWREHGEHILVLAQRGIGEAGVAMPHGWPADIQTRLKRVTNRRIVLRPHPAIYDRSNESEPDFRGAHAVVTWASGAAIKAIAAGVPAFHEFDRWIGAPAASLGYDDLEQPFLGDRLPMFQRLAWAMWSLEEISKGDPFRWLLEL